MWILKLKSVDSEVKSVDSEAKKCGFVKKNSHFFYCLLPKVWFNSIALLVRILIFVKITWCQHEVTS